MRKVWVIVACILVTLEVCCAFSVRDSPAPTPSHSGDSCDALIYKMVECVPYLGNSGNEDKPESSCCSGFKKIIQVNEKCLCAALKSSVDLGVDVNLTRVETLPSACGVSNHLLKCRNLDSDDHHSPPAAPKSAPTPSKNSPASSPPTVSETPAPAPVESTASTTTTSVVFAWIVTYLVYCMIN